MRLRLVLPLLLALPLLTLPVRGRAVPAFPGAEGAGANTPGGRGGRVLLVTSLADSGPGTLRAACQEKGPRIVVFRVAGTIALKKPIEIKEPYLTIAGQSAPGDGVCLRDYSLVVETHDVIIRHLRSRLGDVSNQQSDCIDLGHGARNVILDHCSATWSIDECLSLLGNVSDCTIQWCLIGEALNVSKHKKGAHGFGSLSRASGPITWHHNLWIHNNSRNPRLGDNYGKSPYPTFDVRNNVIYNFGDTATGLTQGNLRINYVGNYIRRGPSSPPKKKPISIGGRSDITFFIRDNVYDGHPELTADNSRFFNVLEIDGKRQVSTVDQPFEMPAVTTTSAEAALEAVLATVGASKPTRDSVDARLVQHVRDGTGTIIDSQKDVGGWPELKSGPVPVDSDRDGMPDDWETARGLDPARADDACTDRDQDGYTNVEEYLNDLAS